MTIGEAPNFGTRLIRADSLVPVRDTPTYSIFHGRAIHIPVEEPRVKVQHADQVKVESVDSSGAEAENIEDEMVV